ncbi:sigma factor-like helix-turn-helix DNA-binding protein [Frigidibacter mobilis]|uniref:RNA polymerase sigma factor n=1 Tax=Frigidibacter mobilis TaxID=1335048 RepID=UPI001A91674C
MQAALARLPEDQRRALLLVAVEGLTLTEAAAALDIPKARWCPGSAGLGRRCAT